MIPMVYNIGFSLAYRARSELLIQGFRLLTLEASEFSGVGALDFGFRV